MVSLKFEPCWLSFCGRHYPVLVPRSWFWSDFINYNWHSRPKRGLCGPVNKKNVQTKCFVTSFLLLIMMDKKCTVLVILGDCVKKIIPKWVMSGYVHNWWYLKNFLLLHVDQCVCIDRFCLYEYRNMIV